MQTKDINNEKNRIYKIKDDVSEDQAPDEEWNTTGFTLNIDNRLKPSIKEALDLELKILPKHLEYAFLGEESKLLMIIAAGLANEQKEKLLDVLRKHKRPLSWKISNIKGISPFFCTNKILMEDDHRPSALPQ